MDRHVTPSFQIPTTSIQVFSTVTMLSTIIVYDCILVRIFRRITFHTPMGIGLLVSILATLVARLVEMKRKDAALANGLMDYPDTMIPISVFWLASQYILSGVAGAFMSICHMEFFYDHSSESMRSTTMTLFWVAISIGNYTSTVLVSLVHKCTAGENGSNWLQDDNLNKLEYFVLYITCSKFYSFKQLKVKKREEERAYEENEVEPVV